MATIENIGNIPKGHANLRRVVRAFGSAYNTVVERVTPQQRVPYDQNPDVWPRNIQHKDMTLVGLDEYAAAHAKKAATQIPATEATITCAANGILLEEVSDLAGSAQPQPVAAPDVPGHRAEGRPKLIGWPSGGAHK